MRTQEEKEALRQKAKAEGNRQLWAVYHKGPERLREKLKNDLIPRYEHKRAEWEAKLEELAVPVAAMTVEEAGLCLYDSTRPDWYSAWRKFSAEVALACLPYFRRDELVDGAVYRITCRNSNCGVWREERRGFEIPRYKWGATYLFVEYHWDNGPPFGTAKAWERLDDLPAETVEDEGKRLAYLEEVQQKAWEDDLLRMKLKLRQWDPLPPQEEPPSAA